jgi:hypothetical protein
LAQGSQVGEENIKRKNILRKEERKGKKKMRKLKSKRER